MRRISKKNYLADQIKLMTITTFDLFTKDEREAYWRIIDCIKRIQEEMEAKKKKTSRDPTILLALKEEKKRAQIHLDTLIAQRDDLPREIQPESVLRAGEPMDGITWSGLKPTRKIAEFCSEFSRTAGLQPGDQTWSKIIIKWKNLNILRQIVLNGLTMKIRGPDGTVEEKHYQFLTASAGQLRRDKVCFIDTEVWKRIEPAIMNGLTEEEINRKGGINVNKLMAYTALPSGATVRWEGVSPRQMIVINDFEAPVTGLADFVDEHYDVHRGIHTVDIKHTDGCGMALPEILDRNAMVRAPWIKGLLTPFDYIRFCVEHNVPAEITDIWDKKHDLIAENIKVILTKSQFKLWNFYDGWDDYCDRFEKSGCAFALTNKEEDYFPDKELCYQFLQTLTDMSDQDIHALTAKTHERIENLATDPEAMLRTLQADLDSDIPYRQALCLYPELLRDGYARESLKAIKKRMVLDAKSGRIKCRNKRLFVIPDMYAACEYWFLGIKQPDGLLKDGEIACRIYRGWRKADCLRSPHLYFEHCPRVIVDDDNVYRWLNSNGVYTSCKDLISKPLAFDVDGDQLNIIVEPVIVEEAEREIQTYDIVPVLFDLGKAPPHQLNKQAYYSGLKRAHDYSNIGEVSNNLTKLWNRDQKDRDVAKWLVYLNNLRIDGAKTGFVIEFDQYPEKMKRVNKATGGPSGRMPFFFQFSRNGRRQQKQKQKTESFAKTNGSTMNRLCAMFNDVGKMRINYGDIPPFNWQMLLPDDTAPYSEEVVALFETALKDALHSQIHSAMLVDFKEKEEAAAADIFQEDTENAIEQCGVSRESAYSSIVKYLFADDKSPKVAGKQLFWRIFGDDATAALRENLQNYTVCPDCGMKIPAWATGHSCKKRMSGFLICADCGKMCSRINSKQTRCEECQKKYNTVSGRLRRKKYDDKQRAAME